jgi:lipopolysaccharide/colanic/teichoic acid biosynthesis glycosyltransferase
VAIFGSLPACCRRFPIDAHQRQHLVEQGLAGDGAFARSLDVVHADPEGTVAGRAAPLVESAGMAAFLAATDRRIKRALDVSIALVSLVLLSPLLALVTLCIALESRGPAFYRCRRVGRGGYEFEMLKFRKMVDGAGGPPLRAPDDHRLTRLGSFLGRTRLDEVPQLWNVLKGEMSLVGPRPEDARFVRLKPAAFQEILRVRPGLTGLGQLAFARESSILDPDDRIGHYIRNILPQKIEIDLLYAKRRSLWMDLTILAWTWLAVFLGRDIAVHRGTGSLSLRRRPAPEAAVQPNRKAET